jgi:hypothetical protein
MSKGHTKSHGAKKRALLGLLTLSWIRRHRNHQHGKSGR